MVVTPETLEGVIDDRLWFHYDVLGDVLYLRLVTQRATPALGEETDDELILLRAEADDRPVGLTVVGWWRRFAEGSLPDSICRLASTIEPWSHRFAA